MSAEEKLDPVLEKIGIVAVLILVSFLLYSNLKEASLAQYEFIQEHYDKSCLEEALENPKATTVRVYQYKAYQSCVEKKEEASNKKDYKSYEEQKEDIKKELFNN